MNVLFYLWQWFLFIFLVFWLVFLPGNFLLDKLKVKLTKIENLTVSLAVGAVFFTLLLYIFGSLQVKPFAYVILSIVNLISIPSFWGPRPSRGTPESKTDSAFLIILGAVILGSLLFRSGWRTDVGIGFTEYRDAFWHLGLMRELVRQIPPVHPGFAPLALTNYHYFTHLFGAGFLSLPIFSPLDFYFRIFPFFLAFLYGLSLYIAGRALTKSVLGGNLAIIFGYFTGSLAFVLPVFLKYQGFDWHESSFWLSQPFSMVVNPSFALSASLFLIVIFLLIKIIEVNKVNLILPLILISGTLISFKVYAGLLVLGGLGIIGIWYFLKSSLREFSLGSKSTVILIGFIAALLLSLLLFLPTSGQEAGKFLVFLPGWFLRSMVESSDRVQIMDWVLRENTFAEHGNWWGILRLRFWELLIYLGGNLGVRIIGFITFITIIKNIKRENLVNIFLLITAMAGLLIPLIFVQDGSIANTVQFSYYSLIVFTLFMVMFLNKFLITTKRWAAVFISIILIILAIPTSIKTFYGYVIKPSFMGIGNEEISAFKFLEQNTSKDDIILVPATYQYTESLFVGTISNRRLYYSDRLMAENTHKDFKKREAEVNRFFSSQDKGWNTAFLKDNKINYVYVDKEEVSGFDIKYYPLERVFGNKKVEIYKVF